MFEMTSPGIYNLIQSFIEFTPHFGEGIHCNRLNHSNDSIFQLINIIWKRWYIDNVFNETP